MGWTRNVLFIMCDQLRADFLSCYGNPVLDTPNIDALAKRGVRFSRAYVQSGVCGPSRMSYYTGRYPSSHGATWNFIPMPLSERTLGDYLADAGLSAHLAGKTHFEPDPAAHAALAKGFRTRESLLEGGFSVVTRHEGDLPSGKEDYRAFLQALGYDSPDPWHEFANSGRNGDGSVASGWLMRHAHLPAQIDAEHSETAFVTRRAIRFVREMGDRPWLLHLSYIKPHWPYMAPAPYHDRYRSAADLPIRRCTDELAGEHPVVHAYRTHDESLSFAREEVVRRVRPTYMGLIKEIDDHLGQLFEELDRTGRLDDTLVIFTSDHGDLLGDHGLGEKELFFEQVQNVPLIVVDPDPRADRTRGTTDARLVQAIDVVPTVLEELGLAVPSHRVEGRSLLPLLRDGPDQSWREYAVSELDYSTRRARHVLRLPPDAPCRGYMVRDERWKFVHWSGFRPQLFDLAEDPDEYHDLGVDPRYEHVRLLMSQRLLDWSLGLKRRTCVDHDRIAAMTDNLPKGIHIGQW